MNLCVNTAINLKVQQGVESDDEQVHGSEPQKIHLEFSDAVFSGKRWYLARGITYSLTTER